MIRLVMLLPVVFSLCCIGAALWLRFDRRCGIRNPEYTKGIIVSKVTQVCYRQHHMVELYAPVVRYMTAQGEQTAPARAFSPEWQYRYQQGEQVEICYDRKQPGIFQICRSGGRTVYSTMLFAVGIATLLAYAVLWVQYY